MSREDVEALRAIWATYLASGEFDFESMHTDVEIRDHDIPEGGTYRGHEGFIRWTEEATGLWTEYSLVPREYIDAGDRVVLVADYMVTAAGSGIRLERQDAIVYKFRDERVARIDYFNDRDQALAFAGVKR